MFFVFLEFPKMKRFLNLSVLLLAFCSISAFSQAKFEIEGGDTYDWGVIKEDVNELKAKVIFKNTGTVPLEISAVRPGCGCTTAPLSKNTINPKDTAMLDVTLRVGTMTGQVHKSITITCNDPLAPTKVLSLKAMIQKPLMATPKYPSYGQKLPLGKPVSVKVELENSTDEDLTITELALTPDNLVVDIAKGDKLAKNSKRILNMLYIPTQPASFNTKVIIKTNNEKIQPLEIYGFGDARNPDNDPTSTTPPTVNPTTKTTGAAVAPTSTNATVNVATQPVKTETKTDAKTVEPKKVTKKASTKKK